MRGAGVAMRGTGVVIRWTGVVAGLSGCTLYCSSEFSFRMLRPTSVLLKRLGNCPLSCFWFDIYINIF